MSERQRNNKHIENDYEEAITAALKHAVNKALLYHKQTGHPIFIWEDGKVVRREAKDIRVNTVAKPKN